MSFRPVLPDPPLKQAGIIGWQLRLSDSRLPAKRCSIINVTRHGAFAFNMKQAIGKYLEYLRSVRNSSPHTVLNYGKDLEQFVVYLSPPGEKAPPLGKITHQIIREFVGHLHSMGLQKSSIARKLASLRSFFKYCVREGTLKENPARLVPTPKLPKRIPSVLSAEEMNGFLNHLAGGESAATPARGGMENAAPRARCSPDRGCCSSAPRAAGTPSTPPAARQRTHRT
jgi:integrase